MENKECVVTFKNGSRTVALYFTDDNGDLNLQMTSEPEIKEQEDPDLLLSLVSIFMQSINALNTEENKDESETNTIISN